MSKNNVIFKLDKDDSIVKDGHVLYRLICDGYERHESPAFRIRKGMKGGYVENLNQISTATTNSGTTAWVDENSFVYGDSKITKMFLYNSTVKDSTINGHAVWCRMRNSTVVNSTIAGRIEIEDATISDSIVKRFNVRNSAIRNCNISGITKNKTTISDTTLNNLIGEHVSNITVEF